MDEIIYQGLLLCSYISFFRKRSPGAGRGPTFTLVVFPPFFGVDSLLWRHSPWDFSSLQRSFCTHAVPRIITCRSGFRAFFICFFLDHGSRGSPVSRPGASLFPKCTIDIFLVLQSQVAIPSPLPVSALRNFRTTALIFYRPDCPLRRSS